MTAERIAARCDEHTRAVSVNLVKAIRDIGSTWMLWGRFCAEKNILLYVDGVQALGALEVNVEKWNVRLSRRQRLQVDDEFLRYGLMPTLVKGTEAHSSLGGRLDVGYRPFQYRKGSPGFES